MPESSGTGRDACASRPQLFMVRVWQADLGEGRSEWRGKVQRVATGEVKYFREWPSLIAFLAEMLPSSPGDTAPAGGSQQ